MTRKTITIFASLGVIVLLIGGYFGAQAWIKAHPKTSFDFSDLPESPRLTEFDSAQIIKIENLGEGFVLEKKGNDWVLVSARVPPEKVRLEQSLISNKLWSISSVWAETLVDEAPGDLSVFGLDNPTDRVRVSDSAGKSVEFIFGNFTPSRTSSYVMMADNPAVYTLSSYSVDTLLFSLDSIRNKTLFADFDPRAITRMVLEKRPAENSANQGIIDIVAKAEGDSYLISAFSSYVLDTPYAGRYGVDNEKFGGLLEAMQALNVPEYVDDNPGSLEPYGLDKPGRVFLQNPDVTLDILYGKNEGGRRYAMMAGDNSVFIIEGLEPFIEVTPFSMMDKFAMIFNIDNVDGFTVSADGRTLEATIQGKGDQAVFHLDGKKASDKEFRAFYQAVIGLLIDAEFAGPFSRGEGTDLVVEYRLNTPAGAAASVRLLPYNRDFYVLEREGSREFMIARTQARKIFEFADKMVYTE